MFWSWGVEILDGVNKKKQHQEIRKKEIKEEGKQMMPFPGYGIFLRQAYQGLAFCLSCL